MRQAMPLQITKQMLGSNGINLFDQRDLASVQSISVKPLASQPYGNRRASHT